MRCETLTKSPSRSLGKAYMIASICMSAFDKCRYVNLRKVCGFWMHAFFGLGLVTLGETWQLVRLGFAYDYLIKAKYSFRIGHRNSQIPLTVDPAQAVDCCTKLPLDMCSSALIAGAISESGAAHVLLNLDDLRKLIKATNLCILP